MKKPIPSTAAWIVALSFPWLGGCIDAVTTGVTEGINSALAGVVETMITEALMPITDSD